VQKIRTAVLFVDPIPKIIHNLKYNGQFGLAKPLAQLMLEAWPQWNLTADLVIPIPLHTQRYKERGYNQSALLAKYLCQKLQIPWDAHALTRAKYTTPQVGLSAKDRSLNVKGAFIAKNEKVKGKSILLIDDVCTTGATLSAAAKTLLSANAKMVSSYCLARAL
jgi:ComF family protein